ncbi:hypothetical protein HY745_12955, partial [Candidatus Desantisbacteria bacterium]|nr:hypothetical protein [Candidatus Desantisbacteria bacterium]
MYFPKINMLKLIQLLLIIFLPLSIFAEIVPYDSSIFKDEEKRWVDPFEYYEKSSIVNINKDNSIQINIGKNLGVQQGFIYDIYHKKEVIGQFCVFSVSEEQSEGSILFRKGTIAVNDEVRFARQIDISENPSYGRRYGKKLTGKIVLIEENFCLINLNQKDGIKPGMKFSIFSSKGNEPVGLIEIVDTSKDKESVANVLEKKISLQPGMIVKSIIRGSLEWAELAGKLESDPKTQKDAVYAYEKAIKLGGLSPEIKDKFTILIELMTEDFIKNEMYSDAVYYIRKIKDFDKKYEEKYKDFQVRLLDKARVYWRTGNYILTIKCLEQLEETEEVVRLLSDTLTEVAQEMESLGNTYAAMYCYEKAVKVNPANILYNKNLFLMYNKQEYYDKALNILNKIANLTADKNEKKWAAEQIDALTRLQEKIAPNYNFMHINGTRFNLDSLRGYVIILMLWNVSYESVIEEFRYISVFNERYRDKPLKIIAVNNDQIGVDAVKKFIESNDL